jgi:hypothetical protein
MFYTRFRIVLGRGRVVCAPVLLRALRALAPFSLAGWAGAASAGCGDSRDETVLAAPEAPSAGRYVTTTATPSSFSLVEGGLAAPIVVSSSDYPGVVRVVEDLSADIARVTQVTPRIVLDTVPREREVVIVGTIGKSPLVDQLVSAGKLYVDDIQGRWETSLLQVVEKPFPGVERAFVIAGSDQRGTIFGAYDLSSQMGVSPWYWWDDVSVLQQNAVYLSPGRFSQGAPAVKYRGFFINDENPSLGNWAPGMFGAAPNPDVSWGFNHDFYAKVYEVLLRLKANYLWPAVWGRSLFDDDPENQALAATYGVVMGTSHEAPMMRAQAEWNRYGQTDGSYGGTGEFSFVRNQPALEAYWADSIRRMGDYESIVTVGMRGNGDTGLEDAAGTDLMNRIVETERKILGEVTGKDVTAIPQVWTLYKEVQQYWDDGMRGPDDVIINWCDDNWGNMRELPDLADAPRQGGYGLYYHFDYVGGARNYKWNDTSPLPNVWEQLHLAYDFGVKQLWMVNVGDLKNNEHPLQFFLDYAWNPERLPIGSLMEWERGWAEQQFGAEHAADIATVLSRYGQLQSRRKPELLNRVITVDDTRNIATDNNAIVYEDGSPFSLTNYDEAERVNAEWRELAAEAQRINDALPEERRDAYYQLVLYEVTSTANLYELRLNQFENLLHGAQGRASTNELSARAEDRFAADQAMSKYYNDTLAGGKWKGFQSQAKIGYGGLYPNSSWQEPNVPDFIWPPMLKMDVPQAADMGVAIDGSEKFWPAEPTSAVLPEFSPYQTSAAQYIDVFNRGLDTFEYQIVPGVRWIRAAPEEGMVVDQVRSTLSVDWSQAPAGITRVPITVKGPNGSSVQVEAVVNNPGRALSELRGFVEASGYVSIDAGHWDRVVNREPVSWTLLPNIGRTGDGVTPFPVTAPRQTPGADSPHLEYDLHTFTSGPVEVWAYLSPRNNVLHSDGLKYAVSIDDGEPQIVNVTTALNGIPTSRSWERNTSDNVNLTSTRHTLSGAGAHTLDFWMVDPTVVLQKLVVDTGGLRPSYLGPPESARGLAASARSLPFQSPCSKARAAGPRQGMSAQLLDSSCD